MKPLLPAFWCVWKNVCSKEKGERFHESCIAPTVKHPETIHVWGCFSSRGIGSLSVLPENTAMNKEWYQKVLQEHLLPTIQEHFGEDTCIFQHDGAPCHKAKAIAKWLNDKNVQVLDPWSGNSPDLNSIENLWGALKKQVNNQKPTNISQLQDFLRHEWMRISQDSINQLISSIPKQISEVLKKKGKHCKY